MIKITLSCRGLKILRLSLCHRNQKRWHLELRRHRYITIRAKKRFRTQGFPGWWNQQLLKKSFKQHRCSLMGNKAPEKLLRSVRYNILQPTQSISPPSNIHRRGRCNCFHRDQSTWNTSQLTSMNSTKQGRQMVQQIMNQVILTEEQRVLIPVRAISSHNQSDVFPWSN